MCGLARREVGSAAAGLLVFVLAGGVLAADSKYGLGAPLTVEEIAGWDIDIRPDGVGLPPGQGTAEEGEDIYVQKCAACHGEFGEARGRYPALMGGDDTLASEDPVKTVGSYWPYAATVFDYVRRAMPFGHAQSLNNDEVYAITAFLLNLNEIVEHDEVMRAETLAKVKMPNRDGFVADHRPDTPTGEPCMRDCIPARRVVGRARIIDVTPQRDSKAASEQIAIASPATHAARGKQLFAQCGACHSMSKGQHLVGPSLWGIVGRKAGSASGFARYSDAIRASDIQWTEDNLRRFLARPQEFLSGTTMPFAGIGSEKDLDDLVSYLKEAGS